MWNELSYNKYNDNDTFRNKELFDLDIDYIQYEDFINDVVNNDSVPKDIRYILCNMEEDVLNLFDDNFEHKKDL